ncbi:MAG: TIGR00153 family protein [Magnetococcales bacterium]|nr:TIGR00153 family protein [Magnetococcales bacterium]
MDTLNPFSGMLGKSPFKLIQTHMNKVTECADQMPGLVAAMIQGDANKIRAAAETVNALEKAADEMRNTVFANLPKSLFMPVDRRDLLAVLDLNDEVADHCQHIANALVARNLQVPSDMATALQSTVEQCVGVVHRAHGVMNELDELVETGFSGREAQHVAKQLDELSAARDAAVDHILQLGGKLVAHENTISPLAAVFWVRFLEDIGEIAHAAEKSSNRIRLMLTR